MAPVIIIPARMHSTRFPFKPLAMIGRRPLIEWTWRAALATGWPVIVATDHPEIEAAAIDFGADAEMTGECANGTERCAEVVLKRQLTAEIIINWQGDSPLCPPEYARRLPARLAADPGAGVATLAMRVPGSISRRLGIDAAAGAKGHVSVALSSIGRALYFSRAPLSPLFFHIGLYAYRREALMRYGREPCGIEKAEMLEQLRFLDLGLAITAEIVPAEPIYEVNHPGDIELVGQMLEARQ